jgi:hypothetical protein
VQCNAGATSDLALTLGYRELGRDDTGQLSGVRDALADCEELLAQQSAAAKAKLATGSE